jgi:hypothetical protein
MEDVQSRNLANVGSIHIPNVAASQKHAMVTTVGSTILTSETCSSVAIGVLKAFNKKQSLCKLKACSCGFGALLPAESGDPLLHA